MCTFIGEQEPQLTVHVGDSVRIEEEYAGEWYRAVHEASGAVGIVPASYLLLKTDSTTADVDVVVSECRQTLRQWTETLIELFQVSDLEK
jgi:hypothetical protein